jgi:hypothetical protein
MKITSITAAILGLSLSPSFGGSYDNHDHHVTVSYPVHGGHIDTGAKPSLLSRLSIAPIQCSCSTNIHSLRHAAASAGEVRMLGKIEYEWGSSWLDCHEKEEIDRMILHSGIPFGPDTLIMVLGYADHTGCPDSNVRLTDKRALSVKKHLDQLKWGHRLGFQTATVAMGEEIEFCAHNLGHNRVAEIWVLNLARPIGQVVNVVSPLMHTVAPNPVVAVAPNLAPTTFITERPFIQAPPQTQVVVPQTTPVLPQVPQPLVLPPAPAPQPILPPAPAQELPQAPVQMLPQAPAQVLPQAPAPQQVLPQAPAQVLPQVPAPQQVLPQAPAPQAQTIQPQAVAVAAPAANPHQLLAEFLERNIVLAPNADPNEFARHLNILKSFGSPVPVQ